MCGISVSLSHDVPKPASSLTLNLLKNRGPDYYGHYYRPVQVVGVLGSSFKERELHLSLTSTVLALRGKHITQQPLTSPSGSVLCWNGEVWKIGGDAVYGNDAEVLFTLLEKPAASIDMTSHLSQESATYGFESDLSFDQLAALRNFISIIGMISGPYAFVYYDAVHKLLFYGRDVLGRRSLLWSNKASNDLVLSSVQDGDSNSHWDEVDLDGINIINLAFPYSAVSSDSHGTEENFRVFKVPWVDASVETLKHFQLTKPFTSMNVAVPHTEVPYLTASTPAVSKLLDVLTDSMILRLNTPPDTVKPSNASLMRAEIAILFSGGLDCTVLALLANEILKEDKVVDLLNVAFENPRKAAAARKVRNSTSPEDVDDPLDPYSICPDRMTAIRALKELQSLCPRRQWRLITINVPHQEYTSHRLIIKKLMYPHATEMDLSISSALYFASRGSGVVYPSADQYTTSARVLISGLGADELFGGYSRHKQAFSRQGYTGLIGELQLDISRLGKRNLGRDDRVMSHWGRETRYPYLDEQVVDWAMHVPVWEKCGFGQLEGGELGPEKKILRLLAWRLGLRGVAKEKKRAIQFGACTAKMKEGKTKGTQLVE